MNFHASSLFLHCNSLKLHLPVLCSVYPALLPHVMEVRMSDLDFIYFCQYPPLVAGILHTSYMTLHWAQIKISKSLVRVVNRQRKPGSSVAQQRTHYAGWKSLEEERRPGWTVLFMSFDVPLALASWLLAGGVRIIRILLTSKWDKSYAIWHTCHLKQPRNKIRNLYQKNTRIFRTSYNCFLFVLFQNWKLCEGEQSKNLITKWCKIFLQ